MNKTTWNFHKSVPCFFAIFAVIFCCPYVLHNVALLWCVPCCGWHSGRGVVVGLLKVGCKKLFVYDHHGTQHEMQPLCVLDFYVHESCQRRGYGRKLFEYMLQVSNEFSSVSFDLKI